MAPSDSAKRMVVQLWAIFSLLVHFSAGLFLAHYLQGPKIRPWPCILSVFTMVHRLMSSYTMAYLKRHHKFGQPYSGVVLLVDVVFSLAEAGGFVHQAVTIEGSIQDSILLNETISAVITILLIIIYTCINVWQAWFKGDYNVWNDEKLRVLFPLLSDESIFTAFIRTQAAACIILFLFSFSLTHVVVEPLRESKLLPVKETHSRVFPSNLWFDSCHETSRYPCKPPTFLNVLVARPSISTVGDDKNIASFTAVSVATFGDGKDDPCDFVPQMTRLVKGKQIDVNITWNVLSFGCTYSGIQPQVLVTVNFTQLDVSSDFPFVHVMLGNTNDTKEVIHTTGTPAMILPGENVVGFTKQHVLQRIKSQISATLGISDDYYPVLVTEVVQLRPDPQASESPLIISSPDFATIRIIPSLNIAGWKIIQEYRDKSSLKGLSSLGGLWTLLGNCFALFFGISIMRSVFRSKPLSISGIIHYIQPSFLEQDNWGDKYNIGAEKPRNFQDFVAFMVDHLVDIDFPGSLKDEKKDLSGYVEVCTEPPGAADRSFQ